MGILLCVGQAGKEERNTNRASLFGAPLAPKVIKNRQSTSGGSPYRFRADKLICRETSGQRRQLARAGSRGFRHGSRHSP